MTHIGLSTPTASRHDRRRMLGGGVAALLLGCGLLTPRAARATGGMLSFNALSIPEALRSMGAVVAGPSQLVLTVPEVAEDGALVPVSVESLLTGTREIYLVADVNPDPLAARFSVPAGTDPFVATRIKMAADGVLYAVVSDEQGRVHVTSRPMKVTVGGCS
jgi:sulfur-oxidizing protein SoxY